MTLAYEPKEYETFELVTKALENLDLYQESGNKQPLEQARDELNKAREQDPAYFKAEYFRAMTEYFLDEEAQTVKWLELTLAKKKEENGRQDSFFTEVHYNLAAARYELGKKEKNFDSAIAEFEDLIDEIPADDLVLKLLALAGAALAYAQRNGKEADAERSDLEQARIYNDYVQRELWRDDDFLWRMSLRRKIDKQVAEAINQIVVETRQILASKGTPTKGNRIFSSFGVLLTKFTGNIEKAYQKIFGRREPARAKRKR